MWEMGAAVERGELPREDLESAQRNACPTCGACQFMGSASTGQVLAEALGLALPGSALVPEPLTKLLRYARATGKQIVSLIEQDLRPRAILTREAFENAIVLHAAVGGSTNALLHIPPIAREAGVEVTVDDFDRIHRRVPVLANVKTTGRYPVEYFWYAGGVPAVMLELRDLLHLPGRLACSSTRTTRDWKPANPLFSLDNVIITPHAAYYSEEAIRTVRDFAAHEVVRVLTGQPPLSPVNAAQLAMVQPRH
jgi:dihydroxyacid dehydratase/phosphogluconate dehydratase